MTTAPAKPRPPRATMCSSSTRPTTCRCCRSSAARSPPTGGSPKRRWSGSRRICPKACAQRAGWTAASTAARRRFRRARPAAISPSDLRRAAPFIERRSRAAARARLRHARARHPQRRHIAWPILAGTSAPTLTEAEVRFAMANEWARDRRRHALAALQARPAADAATGRGLDGLDGGAVGRGQPRSMRREDAHERRARPGDARA